jgi:hypothetical protein
MPPKLPPKMTANTTNAKTQLLMAHLSVPRVVRHDDGSASVTTSLVARTSEGGLSKDFPRALHHEVVKDMALTVIANLSNLDSFWFVIDNRD